MAFSRWANRSSEQARRREADHGPASAASCADAGDASEPAVPPTSEEPSSAQIWGLLNKDNNPPDTHSSDDAPGTGQAVASCAPAPDPRALSPESKSSHGSEVLASPRQLVSAEQDDLGESTHVKLDTSERPLARTKFGVDIEPSPDAEPSPIGEDGYASAQEEEEPVKDEQEGEEEPVERPRMAASGLL